MGVISARISRTYVVKLDPCASARVAVDVIDTLQRKAPSSVKQELVYLLSPCHGCTLLCASFILSTMTFILKFATMSNSNTAQHTLMRDIVAGPADDIPLKPACKENFSEK